MVYCTLVAVQADAWPGPARGRRCAAATSSAAGSRSVSRLQRCARPRPGSVVRSTSLPSTSAATAALARRGEMSAATWAAVTGWSYCLDAVVGQFDAYHGRSPVRQTKRHGDNARRPLDRRIADTALARAIVGYAVVRANHHPRAVETAISFEYRRRPFEVLYVITDRGFCNAISAGIGQSRSDWLRGNRASRVVPSRNVRGCIAWTGRDCQPGRAARTVTSRHGRSKLANSPKALLGIAADRAVCTQLRRT